MNALNMTEETNIDTSKNESPVLDPVTGSNNGREDYLDWNEYFMAVSFLSAQRSKDPATQVGIGVQYILPVLASHPLGCTTRAWAL